MKKTFLILTLVGMLILDFLPVTAAEPAPIPKTATPSESGSQAGINADSFKTWKTAYIGAPESGAINWRVEQRELITVGPCSLIPRTWGKYFSCFYNENIGLKDYTARFVITKRYTINPFGFAVRFQDIDNHYLFYITNLEDIEFYRVSGGKREKIASARGRIPFGVDTSIELNVLGNDYTMLINGEPALAARDSALSGGGFAFMASDYRRYSVKDFRLFGTIPPPESIKPLLLKPVYPLWVDGSSAILMWETSTQLPSRIEYGTVSDALKLSKSDSVPVRVHKIQIDNLQKGTKYYYKVFSGDLSCGEGSFQTAPEPGTPIRFAVIGDTQTGKSGPLNEFIVKSSPLFVISPGDIVGTGCVADDWDLHHFSQFRSIYKIAPCYVALAGHEIFMPKGIGNSPYNNEGYWFTKYFPYPGTSDNGRHYYAFTYSDVRFIMLDMTYDPVPAGKEGSVQQYKWLTQELESDDFKKARWHVLVYHVPLYSCGWKSWTAGGGIPGRKYLQPLLEKYKIDVLFGGHTHTYERGYLNGVLQIITGGGCNGGDDYGRNFFHVQKFSKEAHYCMVDVNSSSLTMSVYNIDNKMIDKVTLEKGKTWELTAKPVVLKPAQNGGVGEQDIVVSCPEMKGTKLCWRAVLAERREKDPFWEPTKEAWDGGSEVHLKVKFPEPGTYTVKVQAMDKDLRPTEWVDAGKVEIKKP